MNDDTEEVNNVHGDAWKKWRANLDMNRRQ
jgi:hypothetical protein